MSHPIRCLLCTNRLATGHADHWIPLRRYLERVDQIRADGGDVGLPLAVRRALALVPRPGDHPGGPIDYWTGEPLRRAA